MAARDLNPPLDPHPRGFLEPEFYKKDCAHLEQVRSRLPITNDIIRNLEDWNDILQWHLPKGPRPLIFRGIIEIGDEANIEIKKYTNIDYFYYIHRSIITHYTILFVSSHGLVVVIDTEYPHASYKMRNLEDVIRGERKLNQFLMNQSASINYKFVGPESLYSREVLPIQFIFNSNCFEYGMCHLMAYILLIDLIVDLETRHSPKSVSPKSVIRFFAETNTHEYVNRFYNSFHRFLKILNMYLYGKRE